MAVDSSKFNHLSLSQLNELLEDDAKLGQMAQEMDEVGGWRLAAVVLWGWGNSVKPPRDKCCPGLIVLPPVVFVRPPEAALCKYIHLAIEVYIVQ